MLQKSLQGSKKRKIVLKKLKKNLKKDFSALKTPLTLLPENSSDECITTDSFEKAVKETKAENEVSLKRPVGRPKKNQDSASSAKPVSLGTNSEVSKSQSGTPEPQNLGLGTPIVAPPAPTLLSSGIPKDAIRHTLQIPFAIAAVQTEFPGFALDKKEADEIVPLLDHCIVQYLPAIAGPHAVAWTLAGALLSSAAVKYMAYQDWKKENANRKTQ